MKITNNRKRRLGSLINFAASVLVLVIFLWGRDRVPSWSTIPVLILIVISSVLGLMAEEDEAGPDSKSYLILDNDESMDLTQIPNSR